MKKSPFVVVSFAIKEWSASPEPLINSLERFGIQHDIHELDQKEAKAIKYSQAVFLKKMLAKHKPFPVVWMNPDTIVNRYPIQFDVQSTDVALYVYEPTWTMYQTTIYLANKPSIRKLLDLWIETDDEFPDRLQSDNLRTALVAWQRARSGRIGVIPFSYIDGSICGGKSEKTS